MSMYRAGVHRLKVCYVYGVEIERMCVCACGGGSALEYAARVSCSRCGEYKFSKDSQHAHVLSIPRLCTRPPVTQLLTRPLTFSFTHSLTHSHPLFD